MSEASPPTNGNGKNGLSVLWPNLITTGILLIAFVGGFWSLADPRADLKDIRGSYLSKNEYHEFEKRIDANIARIDDAAKPLQATIVPRGEHLEKWNSTNQAIANLQRQIDDLTKSMGSNYTLRDKIAELQQQSDDQQKQLLEILRRNATKE